MTAAATLMRGYPLGTLDVDPYAVQRAVQSVPKVLAEVGTYAADVAKIAPKARTIIDDLLPFLPAGPLLAPLVAPVSKDAANFLKDAPSYTGTLRTTSTILARAPALVTKITAISGTAGTFVTKLGNDPALVPFVDRFEVLVNTIEAKRSATGPAASAAAANTAGGVGLAKALPWLNAGIVVARHPWLVAAGPLALIGGLVGLGVVIGVRVGRRR